MTLRPLLETGAQAGKRASGQAGRRAGGHGHGQVGRRAGGVRGLVGV